jgi:hypothetical protein
VIGSRAAVALCCGAFVLLPGCGSGGNSGTKIPADPSNRMIALIQKADSQSAAGVCGGAVAKVREAEGVLATDVPKTIDKDLRQGLEDGLAHMRSLIAQECQRPQQTQTQTTPTESTPTETTQTETTQTQTTPTETTQTQTQPTDTTTVPTSTTPTTTTGTGTTTTGTGGTPPPPGQ